MATLTAASTSPERADGAAIAGAGMPAKKVNGRKRHIAVDVMGLVLDVVITRRLAQPAH